MKGNILNLSIPDPGEVEDFIEVSISPEFLADFTLSGVTVIIDSVVHPEVSDLAFILSHDNIIDTLIEQSEIADSNIFGCSLTDASTILLEEGISPYNGSFMPHNPLSVFSGVNLNGQWTLKVIDLVSGNSGVLQSWGLKLFFDAPTEIESDYSIIPKEFQLYQNFPNPFNPGTVIGYQLPVSSDVTLKVYDLLGREVATLVDEYKPAGNMKLSSSRQSAVSNWQVEFISIGCVWGNLSRLKNVIVKIKKVSRDKSRLVPTNGL